VSAFDLCLEPYERQAFLNRWWEREPLVIKRREPGRFRQLVSRAAFDDLVAHSNLRVPFFRLFIGGDLISPSACTTVRQLGRNMDTGLADLNAVYDGFAEGATVVLSALEKVHAPLTTLCGEMEFLFRCPFQAYAYLAPPQAHGPPAHYDTHDVIVLQVEGSKHWRIWKDPWPLPMRMAENAYDHDAVIRFTENNAPIADEVLEPGDSLYLPRGFIHVAETSAESSLHITLSAMVVRWLDLIDEAAHLALSSLKHDCQAQGALAFGRHPGAPVSDEDDYVVAELAGQVIRSLDVDQIMTLAEAAFNRSRIRYRKNILLNRLARKTAVD
jgi:bifunctional lysine-specific demethylase and histidyl-hydroxylase NO66